MSLMLVLLTTAVLGTAKASDPASPFDPDQPELAPRDRQAIAAVDVMPIVERLHDQLNLAQAPTAALVRVAASKERALLPDPLGLVLRGPDTLLDLFALIAMLRELHRRDALDLRLRGIESGAAFRLGQLGARYLTDPLLDRQLRAWRDSQADPRRAEELRDLSISIQAASEIGDRWFAETLQPARVADPASAVLDARIGLWLISVGERGRGVSYLQQLRGMRPDRPEVLRALGIGLRAAGREPAADALRDELRATAPLVHRELVTHERMRADHKAEVAFRVSPRPRPVQAWIDHVQRVQRDPAATRGDVDRAVALAREDHPSDLRLARLGATVLAARGDPAGLSALLERALADGVDPEGLRDVQVVAAMVALVNLAEADDVAERVAELDRALVAWRDGDPTADPAVVDGVRLIGALMRAARSDHARDRRRAVRAAQRMARRHAGDPVALRAAAAGLRSLQETDRAMKVLDKRARRLPPMQRASLRLDAAALGMLELADASGPTWVLAPLDALDEAEQLGARPEVVRVWRARLALIAALGDGVEVTRATLQAQTMELDEALRRLGGRPEDEALIAATSRTLAAAWLSIDELDRAFEALGRARRFEPDHPFAEFLLGVFATLDRAPTMALMHLGRASALRSWAQGEFALARWTQAACEQLDDRACVVGTARTMLDAWDAARAPDAIGVWATPWLQGEVLLSATLSVDGPLALHVSMITDAAPLLLLPHDRAALRSVVEAVE